MKSFCIVIFYTCTFGMYAQTKKEQIASLSSKLGNLKALQANEHEIFNKWKNQFDGTLSSNEMRISQLIQTEETKKQTLHKQKEENHTLAQHVLALQSTLKTVQDSIKKLKENEPMVLLDSRLITLVNEEIIRLMNVKDEDLGEAFINVEKPELKPSYEIIGKQLFQIKGKTYCMVVMGVTNPNTYHISSGTNYLACFEVNEEKWNVLRAPLNTEFNPVGWGLSARVDKFVQFGDRNIAVILEGGYLNQGIYISKRAIYGLDNEKEFHLIFEGDVSYGNSNDGFGENFDVKFQKSTNSCCFNLIETKDDGKKLQTRTLKFNEATMKYE